MGPLKNNFTSKLIGRQEPPPLGHGVLLDRLENLAHLLRVAFLLLERSVLWVRIDVTRSVLASPVPEFFLCHVAPDIGSRHDPHDLLVVVQDAQSWLVFPFRQEVFEFLVLSYISLCLRVVYCHPGVLGADLPQGLGA